MTENSGSQTHIPNEDEWGNCSYDLDIKDAYNIFFGKSNEEMQKYFKKMSFPEHKILDLCQKNHLCII
jgi:hypothetical protein